MTLEFDIAGFLLDFREIPDDTRIRDDINVQSIELFRSSLEEKVGESSLSPRSKQRYLEGLTAIEVAGNEVGFRLEGAFPNMLEGGWPETDLRDTILQGRDSAVVMFEHHLTRSAARREGGRVMSKRIARQAKQLRIRRKYHKTTERLAYGLQRRSKARHKHDIVGGMEKFQKRTSTGRFAGSGFRTFRTISRNVTTGWIHPGIQAHNFFRDVSEEMRADVVTIVDRVIARALAGG